MENTHKKRKKSGSLQTEPEDGFVKKKYTKRSPLDTILCVTNITFEWMTPTIIKGFFRPLEIKDVYDLPKGMRAEKLNRHFRFYWSIFKNMPLSLYCALFAQFWGIFLFSGLLKVLSDIFLLISPFILQIIIRIINEPVYKHQWWEGWAWVGLLAFFNLGSSFLNNQFMFFAMKMGIQINASLVSSVFQKALRLSSKARAKRSGGKVVNLMSVDAQRIGMTITFLHMFWSSIFQVVMALVGLFILLGLPVVGAIATVLFVIPTSMTFVYIYSRGRIKILRFSDKRVAMVNEILQGIRTIKYFNWEKSYIFVIEAIRTFELKTLQVMAWCRVGIQALIAGAPTLVAISCFVLYALFVSHGHMDPSVIFPSITFLNILRFPLMLFPMLTIMVMDASISMKRLDTFFRDEEMKDYINRRIQEDSEIDSDSEILENFNSEIPETLNPEISEISQKSNLGNKVISETQQKPKDLLDFYPIIMKNANFKWGVALKTKKEERDEGNEMFLKKRKKNRALKAMKLMVNVGSNPMMLLGAFGKVFKRKNKKLKETGDVEEEKLGRLKDLTFKIPKGKLTCVVGSVGSGKSSFFNALLGEMEYVSGDVFMRGTTCYTPQQAWSMNGTIKQNILFGSTYDEKKYKDALYYACLEKDLEVFPNGDKTEIGEKGVTLSGGQKQRIGLARAIFSDRDIYLLDDPLSAVDAHVGRFIFEKCIKEKLRNKTVILATHQIQYLKQSDNLIILEHGCIAEQGKYEDLMKIPDSKLKKLVKDLKTDENDKKNEKKNSKEQNGGENKTKQAAGPSGPKPPATLMQAEERNKGNISFKNVNQYVGYMGGWFIFLIILFLFAFCQAMLLLPNVILAEWSANAWDGMFVGALYWIDTIIIGTFFPWNYNSLILSQIFISNNHANIGYLYLVIWAFFGFFAIFVIVVRDIMIRRAGIKASRKMHQGAFTRLMFTPSWFFDTTPLGRILARFSKDIEMIDSQLIDFLQNFLHMFFLVAGMLIFVAISTMGIFILPLIPILVIYFVLFNLYRSTQRELKRIESILRSPLYSHFAETLSGITVLRSYDNIPHFLAEHYKKLNEAFSATFMTSCSQRWLGFRLECIGAILVASGSLITIVLLRGVLPAGVAGLSLSYLLSITQLMAQAISSATELEANFNNVERLLHYVNNLPQEPPHKIKTKKNSKKIKNKGGSDKEEEISTEIVPERKWPDKGMIQFKNFSFRYRPGLPLVLDKVNILIKAGEKVGVCGRTGAGKSTLMLALFRFQEPAGGAVIVDGVNIGEIGLAELRRNICIIPQDPTLFTGSVRMNLDPFNEKTDDQLWDVLKKAHLDEKVAQFPKNLASDVGEGGSKFSVGERQLLCLARALTKFSKILVLDEATANVDFQTDSLIQETIRKEFSECTRLTIAHRINTIIDSDRILVLDKGRIAEFETPRNLLLDKNSIFRSLVEETGKANATFLKKQVFGEIEFSRLFGEAAEDDSERIDTQQIDIRFENSEDVVSPNSPIEEDEKLLENKQNPLVFEEKNVNNPKQKEI